MTDTRQALAALLPCPFCGNSKGLAVANENPQDLSGGYFIACPSCDASTGLRFACGEDPIPLLIEQWNRRAALSAQPVAGAVAHTSERHFALREAHCIKAQDDYFAARPVEDGAMQRKAFDAGFVRGFDAGEKVYAAPQPQAAPAPEPSRSQKMHEAGFTARDTRLTCDECGAKFTRQFAPLHECAQPEPSAQALDIAFELGRVEAMQETSAFNASALRKALSAMLTHFGMDEDEWNKPTLDQARAALAEYDSFTLHPATADLVRRFSQALAEKLAAAEAKYGYSDGWASPDWMDECRTKLMEHIAKGDPRDVAAYCAFLWHHGASTARPEPSAQGRPCPFGCTTQEEHDAHQSAEPSAQAVREPGDPLHDDAYVRGVAVGFVEDDSRRTTLLRIADRMQKLAAAPQPEPSAQAVAWIVARQTAVDVGDGDDVRTGGRPELGYALIEGSKTFPSEVEAMGAIRNAGLPLGWVALRLSRLLPSMLASAPSTPPHAVVEAVPLTDEQIDLIADEGHRNAVGGIYATAVYQFAAAIERAHGIAPKAAQEPRDA